MPDNKIIDLTPYRQEKARTGKDLDSSDKADLPFEKKLQAFIHRPFDDLGSVNELIAIFEEDQLEKDGRDNDQ